MADGISRDQAKEWWLRCVSCSEASATLINRDAGEEAPLLEQASHLFSGGFMHQGHACGHLWGAALAAGIRASKTFTDDHARSAAALHAASCLVGALSRDGWALTCRENTGFRLTSLAGRLQYLRSDKPRACGRKAMVWAAQANATIDDVLADFDPDTVAKPCANCAVDCMSKVAVATGLEEEEPEVVAGFAGGLGLTGNVCAALSVGVFALSVRHYVDRRGGSRESKYRAAIQELNLINGGLRKRPSRLLRDFGARLGDIHCKEIVGRGFESIDDHTHHIENGGCREVIEFVVDWLNQLWSGSHVNRV